MTQHPMLAADETEVKGRDKEGGEVSASRKEDEGSAGSNLPSAPPDTSKFEV